jgi:hypothetical protein
MSLFRYIYVCMYVCVYIYIVCVCVLIQSTIKRVWDFEIILVLILRTPFLSVLELLCG